MKITFQSTFPLYSYLCCVSSSSASNIKYDIYMQFIVSIQLSDYLLISHSTSTHIFYIIISISSIASYKLHDTT